MVMYGAALVHKFLAKEPYFYTMFYTREVECLDDGPLETPCAAMMFP